MLEKKKIKNSLHFCHKELNVSTRNVMQVLLASFSGGILIDKNLPRNKAHDSAWAGKLELEVWSQKECEEYRQHQNNQSKVFGAKSSGVHCCINKSFKRIMRQFTKSPLQMDMIIMLKQWRISHLCVTAPDYTRGGSKHKWGEFKS